MGGRSATRSRRDLLVRRLDEIAASLAASGHGLALLALGSSADPDRMDEFSDLDFFAIVRPGGKREFLGGLQWLAAVAPIAYAYRNTADGYKVLFADGVFCELAVFEPHELSAIPFAPGRIVWRADGFDEAICRPRTLPQEQAPDVEWLIGECLTNLYAGMCRWRRGELLAAARAIQVRAVDALAELIAITQGEQAAARDPFANERRFESRFPEWASELGPLMQGYAASRDSALAVLALLEVRFHADRAMAEAIRALCAGPPPRV